MRLIKSSFTIIEQGPGIDGIYKIIEQAGRTCYKSEDKITPDSAKAFVDRMIKSGHGAMLEHGTVYLKANIIYLTDDGDECEYYPLVLYSHNKYSEYFRYEGIEYVTTNYRVLVENDWLDDLQYICEPTEFHDKRITVHFICDRGVSHEFVRHRVFSFAQESTRYCNYSKDKFGNELTFIIPNWADSIEPGTYEVNHKFPPMWGYDHWMEDIWFHNIARCEEDYITMVKEYLAPQQARAVLPNSLKTELVMTGFVSDWRHFFELRCASNAHPQAQELAKPLYEEFIKNGWLEVTGKKVEYI